MKKYKVIIWGLGNVGRSALIHVQSKESMELVVVYDVAPNKIGKDVGEVFGYEKAGVAVTDDRKKVLNTDADVVLYYTPQMYDGPEMTQPHMTGNCDKICEILSHKKNVITTCCMYHSKKLAPEFYKKSTRPQKPTGQPIFSRGSSLGCIHRTCQSSWPWGPAGSTRWRCTAGSRIS